MIQQTHLDVGRAVRLGLLGGVVALYMALVGMVGTFAERPVVAGVISLGHTLLFLTGLGAGYLAARRAAVGQMAQLLAGALAGLMVGVILSLLVVIGNFINLRAIFLNASQDLYSLLTVGLGLAGIWIPPVGGAALGLLSVLIMQLPPLVRRPLVWGLTVMLILGLFAGLLRTLLLAQPGWPTLVGRFLFASEGLTVAGAAITFGLAAAGILIWTLASPRVRGRLDQLPPAGRRTLHWTMLGLGVLLALLLPQFSGPFIAQVIVLIALYTLMGMGLNIELGFAGLLDLGFVAFFAIGAYTVGLLTSYGQHGIADWSFWAAVPVAVFIALIAGVLLGIPVLSIRGDYLAIATLGFGEITRLLVGSDFLRPWLGGSQGVLAIPKPCVGPLGPPQVLGTPRECFGLELAGPQQLYYLAVLGVVLIAFIAWRLRDSRLGRAWMAIREDEDVAEALGINLVQSKLLAYGLGAAFAGLSGAIFAVMVSSVFPHSMQLLVSINVVAVIIVGGIGSIPGVAVGALALIGLPELFREFAEYRYLFYGIALIVMMLSRPEGLWPSAAIRRELHTQAEEGEAVSAEASPRAVSTS